jgi:GNAT superfamily N-acetyltransferase
VNISLVEDLDALQQYQAVEEAALAHHFVGLPADPMEERVPALEGRPRAGALTRMYVATLDDGTPMGTLTLTFPQLDNLVTANVDGAVAPGHLRRGHGRALLAHGLDLVRAEGRTRVFVEAPWLPDGSDGPAFGFLRDAGARPVLDDYRRILDLHDRPPADPHPVPEGYRLEQWVDVAPESCVDGVAYLMGRMMIDAPMGEMDYEQEKWDAARYRESERDAQERQRIRVVTVVVHEQTGQVAGLTDIGVNRHRPDVAYQWQTIVDPDHRGRRLGMVLKTHNHHYLAKTVPGVHWINTWNAASNSFMIAVNEALGFQVAEKWTEWQLDLV